MHQRKNSSRYDSYKIKMDFSFPILIDSINAGVSNFNEAFGFSKLRSPIVTVNRPFSKNNSISGYI